MQALGSSKHAAVVPNERRHEEDTDDEVVSAQNHAPPGHDGTSSSTRQLALSLLEQHLRVERS